MVKIVKGAMLAAAAGLVLAGTASAELTQAELKCETAASKAAGKFVGSKTKCAIKCQQNAAKALNPIQDCYAPYAGTTAECIVTNPLKPRKSAEEKFEDAIRKACDPTFKVGTDCPECYTGGDCTTEAADRVQNIEGQVDAFGPGVFCLGPFAGSNNPTPPTKEELNCEVNTAKTLSKLVGSLNKCFDKCHGTAFKGLHPVADCDPVTPTNAALIACRDKATSKAILGVDKKCSVLGAIAVPDCNNDATDDYPGGAAWVTLVTNAITGNVPSTYCESPSGAFID